MEKYRLPRKHKKAEKNNLIRNIALDCNVKKKEVGKLKMQVWAMLGVLYHKWIYKN